MLNLDELKQALAHDAARKGHPLRPEIDVANVRRLILDAILLAEEADIALVDTRPIPAAEIADKLERAQAKLRTAVEATRPERAADSAVAG